MANTVQVYDPVTGVASNVPLNTGTPIPNVQSFTPTTGGTVTVVASTAYAIFVKLAPAGGLATATVNLPTGDHPGQKVYITTTALITLITVTPSTGSMLGPILSSLSGWAQFYWDGTNWVRCG